jgi:hypothetical protein
VLLDSAVINPLPKYACLQTALSKLVVGWLQRYFDALLRAGALRLNMLSLGAGLINLNLKKSVDRSILITGI